MSYQDVKNVQDLFYDLIEPLLDESRQQSLKKNLTQIQIVVEKLRLKEPATYALLHKLKFIDLPPSPIGSVIILNLTNF